MYPVLKGKDRYHQVFSPRYDKAMIGTAIIGLVGRSGTPTSINSKDQVWSPDAVQRTFSNTVILLWSLRSTHAEIGQDPAERFVCL